MMVYIVVYGVDSGGKPLHLAFEQGRGFGGVERRAASNIVHEGGSSRSSSLPQKGTNTSRKESDLLSHHVELYDTRRHPPRFCRVVPHQENLEKT
jgi:hypothetical protein